MGHDRGPGFTWLGFDWALFLVFPIFLASILFFWLAAIFSRARTPALRAKMILWLRGCCGAESRRSVD